MNIQLGIAPINWCNDDDPSLGKDTSFEQCIDEMSVAGYVGTELGNKFPRDPIQLKTALDKRGLSLSSAWFSTYFTEGEQFDLTLSRFLEHLSFTKQVGASYINLCECGHAIQQTDAAILGDAKPCFNEQQWQQLIKGLHTLGRIAQDFGMRTVYHYHAGTGVYNAQEIDFLMAHTNADLVGLLLDTGHAAFADIDPIDLIKKYGQRIDYVHLKDIRLSVLNDVRAMGSSFMDAVRMGVFTVPGDGSLDFSAIFQALKQAQYQGWMIVEAEQDPARFPALIYAQKAYAYLKGFIMA